jgi:hypothetical protein
VKKKPSAQKRAAGAALIDLAGDPKDEWGLDIIQNPGRKPVIDRSTIPKDWAALKADKAGDYVSKADEIFDHGVTDAAGVLVVAPGDTQAARNYLVEQAVQEAERR